ncbi:MAG: threonine efflux system [Firmicutes bacterium ADurb.Bin419]|nr:MAG: threonine efflux system [Firmicutes bacterium ADurb.Bin419]
MPGPMLGVTIDGSLKKGYIAGPLVVLGHGILEIILVIVMLFGLKDFFSNSYIAGVIGIFGGAFLAWMGYDMIKSGLKKAVSLEKQQRKNIGQESLILKGAIVSATNPYFILWWASTGIESVRQAYILGVLGVVAFFVGHILSDFTWFTAISITFSKGKKLMKDNIYQWVVIFLGAFIMLFSIKYIVGGWLAFTSR